MEMLLGEAALLHVYGNALDVLKLVDPLLKGEVGG